jgi:hypothetical protein
VRPIWKLSLAGLVLAGCIFAAIRLASPSGVYAGIWKAVLLHPDREKTLCILRIGGDETNPRADILDAPDFKTAETENVRTEDNSLRFRIKTEHGNLDVIVRAPKGDTTPRFLRGSVRDQATYEMLRLERTEERDINPKKLSNQPAGFDELGKAMDAHSAGEKTARIQALLKKHAGEPIAQAALLILLQMQAQSNAAPEELKTTAEHYMTGAAVYGREIELQAALRLTRGLGQIPGDKSAELAMYCGRRAEKLLADDDPPALAVVVLKSLAAALHSSGKAGEAKQLAGRIAELNRQLDDEFAKSAVPFRPLPPMGRRGGSDRVVLVEQFTGATCLPCQGADVALDAALQVYQPSQAVFLQYHVHVPRSDPLTCPAGVTRMQYYPDITGTPTFVLDGNVVKASIGGTAQRGEENYSLLHRLLDRAMEVQSRARIKLSARSRGRNVVLEAEVTELERPSPQTRLHFVLTEELVHYVAPNGQRLHHQVVRDFPGGVSGFPLPGKTARQTVIVDLARIRGELRDYAAFVNSRQPFPDDDLPLELRELKAVAFIQDDDSKQVLQAVQVDVPAPK